MGNIQENFGNDAATPVNVLQEINGNPTTVTNGISQLPIVSNIVNGNENLGPNEPEKDEIRYSENTVPAEADDNSDQDYATANIGVEPQEKTKKRKKKSKSKRGMVTCRTDRDWGEADINHASEGKADGLRGILC